MRREDQLYLILSSIKDLKLASGKKASCKKLIDIATALASLGVMLLNNQHRLPEYCSLLSEVLAAFEGTGNPGRFYLQELHDRVCLPELDEGLLRLAEELRVKGRAVLEV